MPAVRCTWVCEYTGQSHHDIDDYPETRKEFEPTIARSLFCTYQGNHIPMQQRSHRIYPHHGVQVGARNQPDPAEAAYPILRECRVELRMVNAADDP